MLTLTPRQAVPACTSGFFVFGQSARAGTVGEVIGRVFDNPTDCPTCRG